MSSAYRRKLPIAIQTFSDIREGGYYYVDKTPFIEFLDNQNKYLSIRIQGGRTALGLVKHKGYTD